MDDGIGFDLGVNGGFFDGDIACECELDEVNIIFQWVGNGCSRGEDGHREECKDNDSNAGEMHLVSKFLSMCRI